VRVRVYVYVCLGVFVYVYVCVCMCKCMSVLVSVCRVDCLSVCPCEFIFFCVCSCVYVCAMVYLSVCLVLCLCWGECMYYTCTYTNTNLSRIVKDAIFVCESVLQPLCIFLQIYVWVYFYKSHSPTHAYSVDLNPPHGFPLSLFILFFSAYPLPPCHTHHTRSNMHSFGRSHTCPHNTHTHIHTHSH